MYYQFFPEVFLQLQEECGYWPDLIEILGTVQANEFEMKMAHIAAFCEIILDGVYDQESLEKLAEICLKRLKDKRTIHVDSGTAPGTVPLLN